MTKLEELKYWIEIRQEQTGKELLIDENLSEEKILEQIELLKNGEIKDKEEPNDREEVFALCDFPIKAKKVKNLKKKMFGALVGRFAGCLLGVPVENYSIKEMQDIANKCNMEFPPIEYWHIVNNPDCIQYGVNKRSQYTLSGIKEVLVDDDITYTVLNLILLQKYGLNYTIQDVGDLWQEVLPYACTAEECALNQLNKGVKAELVAENNPFVEWIGAAIRADAFGYARAGNPEEASKLSFNDAYLSHRRNGIYGEMFCAGAVASAFTSNNCIDSIKDGLKCIPQKSRLAQDIRWALSYENTLMDYLQARQLLDDRFSKLNCVHTNNNMCAVVFAIILGQNDFTKSISNAIGIGLDNDCTGATVGSIVGANVGISNIPKRWYKCFGDTVRTYIKGYEKVSLKKLVKDFLVLNKK